MLLFAMTVAEKYAIDKAHECAAVFRTNDAEHPGVKMVMERLSITDYEKAKDLLLKYGGVKKAVQAVTAAS